MSVIYSIDGIYFKEFGVQVSKSKGIGDILKRKKVYTYEWDEYHGSSPDLSKPKFEEREITLDCFIVGENWQDLLNKFNGLLSDVFSLPGTRRLLVEPFGYKAMPYDVFMPDGVDLDKSFRNVENVATFKLRLVEPNPIKKVLFTTEKKLNLSYNINSQTEIFYGNGTKEIGLGNVSMTDKVLGHRPVSAYDFKGRNLDLNPNELSDNSAEGQYFATDFPGASSMTKHPTFHSFSGVGIWNRYSSRQLAFKPKGKVTISLEFKTTNCIGAQMCNLIANSNSASNPVAVYILPNNYGVWTRYSVTIDLPENESYANFYISLSNINTNQIDFDYRNLKIEKGETATDYTNPPEIEKYIVIAGNIEDLTDLTSNANVLWDKL